MDWFHVPTEEPSIIFPEGAIIEDAKGIYKILKMEKEKTIHKYTVEVVEQKIPIPDAMKPFIDEKKQTLLILAQNLDKIKRIQ